LTAPDSRVKLWTVETVENYLDRMQAGPPPRPLRSHRPASRPPRLRLTTTKG